MQAGGHPADHARLGIIGQQLDEMTGQPGVIGLVAAQTVPRGKVKGCARRCMTMAAALRGVLLMGLMPDAGYGEILSALFGDLALLPWQAEFAVPAETVLCTWRDAAGPEPLLRLRDMTLAASDAEHEDRDYRAIEIGDLRPGSIGGSLARMPDTPANRAGHGSAGTADDPAPCPQLRDLPVTGASARGLLAVVTGPSGWDKAEAGQALLDRALTEYPHVFTRSRLSVLDRNFPGIARIARMITVTHVLIRLKSDITVTKIGGFLPGGSYMADIGGNDGKIRMRVIEYGVHVDGQDVPEMFCLVTDLDDWEKHPAGVLAAAYKWRRDGPETALREARSLIRGAGPSTGPIFRSHRPDMIRQEHAAWITACELVRATARAAARCRPGPQGPARRAARPPAGDLLHRRPPGSRHHRQGRGRHRQPARRHHHGPARGSPPRPGEAPHRHRPGPAPRPQDQDPAAVPRRRTRHPHPQAPRQDHHLRPPRRLSTSPASTPGS